MAKKYSISTIFKAVDKMSAPVRRMTNSVGNFTRRAEIGLRKVNRVTSKLNKNMMQLGKKSVKFGATAATGLVGSIAVINQMKQRTDNLTKAMGANIETVEAISSAISDVGLTSEHVTDLYEEMNNKFGESTGIEEMIAVKESMHILGLQFSKIKKMAPEQQFQAITNAALKMADASKAASAVDILMGSEANKVLSTLRLKGSSLKEITDQYKKLSFRTEESRLSSERMAKAQSDMIKIVKSMTLQFAGLAGNVLSPMIEQFNKFALANKAMINKKVKDFFVNLAQAIGDITPAIQSAIKFMSSFTDDMKEIVKWGKWIAGLTITAAALSVAIQGITLATTAFNMVMAANPLVWIIGGVTAAVAAFGFAVYKIYDNWSGIKGWFADIWDSIGDAFNGFVDSIVSSTPVQAVINTWSSLKSFFVSMFDGIVSIYNKTIGSIFGEKELNLKSSFDAESMPNDVVASPQARAQATTQETILRTIQSTKEIIDINVRGTGGARLSTPEPSPKINLINMGA